MKKRYQCFKKKYHRNLENRKKYESSGIDGDGGWVGGFDILILSFIPNPYGMSHQMKRMSHQNDTYVAPNETYVAPNETYVAPNEAYVAPNEAYVAPVAPNETCRIR